MSNIGSHSISFENLSVGYKRPLFQDISIGVSDFSGVIGLIGNNGKGKTTLLKTISGLLEPLSGKIVFDGKDMAGITMADKARVVSFGLSASNVFFPVSAHELISMGRYPYNNHWAKLSDIDDKIISNAMDMCGIRALGPEFVSNLSDGERQKVFIAKTIAQDTPLILFDEPTAFLDYGAKKQFFQSVQKLARENGKIVMISSHDIDFLTMYADSLLMIEDNGETTFGRTGQIMAEGYFKANFTQ